MGTQENVFLLGGIWARFGARDGLATGPVGPWPRGPWLSGALGETGPRSHRQDMYKLTNITCVLVFTGVILTGFEALTGAPGAFQAPPRGCVGPKFVFAIAAVAFCWV